MFNGGGGFFVYGSGWVFVLMVVAVLFVLMVVVGFFVYGSGWVFMLMVAAEFFV